MDGPAQRVTHTGQSVLILGATGSAGQLAIQIAKHLGANAVFAAGRERTSLPLSGRLGADDTIDPLPPLIWSHTIWRRRRPTLMWSSIICGANLPRAPR